VAASWDSRRRPRLSSTGGWRGSRLPRRRLWSRSSSR